MNYDSGTPYTGKEATCEQWDKYFYLKKGTMERRVKEHGADCRFIFKTERNWIKYLRKVNSTYSREEFLGKKQRKLHEKLEAAGQLKLFK